MSGMQACLAARYQGKASLSVVVLYCYCACLVYSRKCCCARTNANPMNKSKMNAEVLAKLLLPQTVILPLIPKHAHCRFEHVVDACYVVLFCRGASTLRSVVTRREKEHLSSRWNIRICNFTHSLYFSQFDCHLRLLIFAEVFCVWGC